MIIVDKNEEEIHQSYILGPQFYGMVSTPNALGPSPPKPQVIVFGLENMVTVCSIIKMVLSAHYVFNVTRHQDKMIKTNERTNKTLPGHIKVIGKTDIKQTIPYIYVHIICYMYVIYNYTL